MLNYLHPRSSWNYKFYQQIVLLRKNLSLSQYDKVRLEKLSDILIARDTWKGIFVSSQEMNILYINKIYIFYLLNVFINSR